MKIIYKCDVGKLVTVVRQLRRQKILELSHVINVRTKEILDEARLEHSGSGMPFTGYLGSSLTHEFYVDSGLGRIIGKVGTNVKYAELRHSGSPSRKRWFVSFKTAPLLKAWFIRKAGVSKKVVDKWKGGWVTDSHHPFFKIVFDRKKLLIKSDLDRVMNS